MYVADLHIHSRYSLATSRDCTPEYLDLWARRKGIHIVGSGDFTHPAWREELKEKLEPAEDGLYRLKKEYRIEDDTTADSIVPRFVITGEISSIYKKYGRVRKVHSLILLPGLEDAELISHKLEAIGNIHSDGRPILGLDCRDLLEILLELCPKAVYVPAHIWTPHFSLFGAFSGFDSVEECYDDLSPYIHAMETGLSSDPPMNWRVSALDRFQLISNSDAHSPAKLGREANLLDIELSYEGLREAIQTGKGLYGTIEFFPEEGKYHYDGHRKCSLCLRPVETQAYHGICPVCGKKLTIGVSHRIEQLADREEGYKKGNAAIFESLVPLPEVIGASTGRSSASAKVRREYMNMLQKLGPEFEILRRLPLEEIQTVSGHLVAEGIGRLRNGQVTRIPGYDGEYGSIKLFTQNELEHLDGQLSLFDVLSENTKKGLPKEPETGDAGKISGREMPAFGPVPADSQLSDGKPLSDAGLFSAVRQTSEAVQISSADGANERQIQAIESMARITAVTAGPGTGKTRTLVSHILYLLEARRIKPSQITAVTFTNQAAEEMRERIRKQLGKGRTAGQIQIGTFHSIALKYLKEHGMEFTLAGDMETRDLAGRIIEEAGLTMSVRQFLTHVSHYKTGLLREKSEYIPAIESYQNRLREMNALDFDDLLLEALRFAEETERDEHFSFLMVDEFQDISPLQYRLIQAWNKSGRELFVIGDPDQAIYGFRGADSRCFERLTEEFPETKKVLLVENYRSTPQILALASEVISENPGEDRCLVPSAPEGTGVRLVKADSDRSEAIFVAKEINRLAGGIGMLEAQEVFTREEGRARSFDDIAVLYRTHRQAALLETCLKKEGIPYIVAGRDDFLMESEVQGTICFFKSLQNPENCLAGQTALKLLWKLEAGDMADIIYTNMAEKYMPLLKKKPQKILEQWMDDLELNESAAMQKLCRMAVFYRTMGEFTEALDLGIESDLKRVSGKTYTAGAVTLMTLHGSKGLEFPAVIIYGAEKGMIPFESEKHPADMEEERRLFYVGITRAKEELILTASGEASEFLQNIPEDLMIRGRAGREKRAEEGRQLNLFDFMKS